MDYCWVTSPAAPSLSHDPGLPAPHDLVLLGWAGALDARAQLPQGYSQRLASLAARLARALGLDEAQIADLSRGALLHDLGMIQIPDSVLRKPGPLSAGEWALIRMHPVYAEELLAPIPMLRPATSIPRYHHECWDGSGYPYGLRGRQIPLAARIFAVADAWAAMTTDRPHRRALPPEVARQQLCEASGRQFDPAIVEAFLSLR
ncbi:MAG: HD-GYP domain-containing protein [Oscillochloridaceae bacterium umkhey_bin13]